MNVIYNKHTGRILNAISPDQNFESYYEDSGQDFIDELDSILVENVPLPLYDYYVKDSNIYEYTDEEKEEIKEFRKVLTPEERLIEKLKPSKEEIQKALQTIEILSLIQEVI